nr:hypothetical protein [Tanacetum cinerariifolium]
MGLLQVEKGDKNHVLGQGGLDGKVNDVTRLQAIVDKKKVVVTEAAIREVLRLDDAEGVDCLPNEEIFAKLARMGYEKTSTKLTPSCSRKFNFSKYIFDSLGMLVEQEIKEEADADEHVEEVNTGDATHGDDCATHGESPTATEEPSIPSPTPPIPPPQPPQDIPSTSQVQQTLPQSPQVQPPSPLPQPQQAADFPMSLLREAIDACAALTKRLEHLEYDKVAQALEITKLKRRRVDTFDDTVMDDESNQGRMIAQMNKDDVVVLKDDKEEHKDVADAVKDVEKAKEDETKPAEVQEVVDVVTTAKLITKVVTAASETVTATSAIIPTAEPQVPNATLTAAPARVAAAPSRKRKRVVIRDPEEESTTSTIIPTKTKSKDKGKGILAINHVKRKAKEDLVVQRYRVLKRKPQTKEYDCVLKESEKAAKRRKLNEEVEDLKRDLQIMPNEDDDVYTEATLLARKVPVVDYEIIKINNKPYYKIIRANGTHQLYIKESKNCTWSRKGQELEATGIMWCAYHNLYNRTTDFVSGKENLVLPSKVDAGG